jgi:hypothetical protein
MKEITTAKMTEIITIVPEKWHMAGRRMAAMPM